MPIRRSALLSTANLLAMGTLAWIAFVMAGARQRPALARDVPAVPGEHAPPAAALEPGRGRMARQPSDIPARGWRDIIVRTYQQVMEDRITTIAAGITFFGLLALFPAVTALVSVYGLFADPVTVRDHLFALSFMLPAGTFQIVEDQITRIVAQDSGALTFKLVLGLGIALWGANAGMKAVIDGLNVAYEETEKRSFIGLNVLSLALTLAGLVVVLLAIFTVTIAPAVIAALRMSDTATTALRRAALAGDGGGAHHGPVGALSVRAEPGPRPVALGDMGRRLRRASMDRRLGRVVGLSVELCRLHGDLWLARRGGGADDVDLAVRLCRADRCRIELRNGASDGGRQHHGSRSADGIQGRRHGRYAGAIRVLISQKSQPPLMLNAMSTKRPAFYLHDARRFLVLRSPARPDGAVRLPILV